MPEPIVLLDLDAAGLDPTQPCPPEFMQFIYDNSQDHYLTLWSRILSEPDGASRIRRWLDEGLAVYYARTIKVQMAPPTDKPEGDHVTEVTYSGAVTAPPVNVKPPVLSGIGAVGEILSCTTGNWSREPTSYNYQWLGDGTEIVSGTDSTHAVVAADAGKTMTCVVTAANAAGSTAAPPSNAIIIAAALHETTLNAEATINSRRREYPKKD